MTGLEMFLACAATSGWFAWMLTMGAFHDEQRLRSGCEHAADALRTENAALRAQLAATEQELATMGADLGHVLDELLDARHPTLQVPDDLSGLDVDGGAA